MSYGDTTHPDRLTNFNGTTIPYNAYGYPTKRGDYTLSWSKGRLSGASKGSIKTGGESYSYTYNALGQRIKKSYIKYLEINTGTIQPVYKDTLTRSTTTYSYDNAGRLINEYVLETYSESGDVSREMTYLYDASGMIGFVERYNGTTKTYYYNRNLQGDVTEIYDNTGALKVTYRYDAWGNCTISGSDSGLGNRNKIRYRGYYFDKETEFYFLNSRYYNPEWRRFISPDDTAYIDPESVNGLNLYCYCNNDPVNFVDPSGHLAFFVLTAIIGAMLGLGIVAAIDYSDDQKFNLNWQWYLLGGVAGAVIGGFVGAGISYYATGSAFSSVGKVWGGLFGKTALYRSVSANELNDIKLTKRFNLIDGQMEAKQFGLSLDEVKKFAKFVDQSDIVSVKIPNRIFYRLDHTAVDTIIFKSGVVTVGTNMLELFNSSIYDLSFLS